MAGSVTELDLETKGDHLEVGTLVIKFCFSGTNQAQEPIHTKMDILSLSGLENTRDLEETLLVKM